MITNTPMINIRLLSFSIPYKTANIPIIHIAMIRVFFSIYNLAFNAIDRELALITICLTATVA